MANAQFNVVVDGQLLPGFDHDTVLAQLQQQLKLPEAKARQLIGGSAVTVKRDIAAEVADAYCKRLRALGVSARRVPTAIAAPAIESVETRAYFAALPTPLPKIRNSGAFQRALYGARSRLLNVVVWYSALVVFAIAATLYFIIHFAHLLTAPPILFSATIYLLPLIALLGLCALLLRPFLPMATKPTDSIVVTPYEQPQLYAFIAQLSAVLGVKAPESIALNMQPQIRILPLPGFKNFWNKAYRLTVGVPLLDACNIQQLAGILAGELRTTAVTSGLRYAELLRLIRQQLHGCTNNEDWLYRQISRLRARGDRFARLLDATRILFEQSNTFLQKFAARAETVNAQFARALLREQDRYLARLVGSSTLPTILLIKEKLRGATQDAIAKNTEDRIDAGLVDNLPALIKHYYDSLDEKFERELQRRWDNEAAPRRNAPPITRERIEQITAAPALFACIDAAVVLLNNAADAATAVTQQSYRAAGHTFDANTLLSVDDLTYAATQDILQRQQAGIYFNNWFKPFRFWKLAEYKLIRDMPLQDAAEQLSVCVNEIRRLSPDRFKLLAEYDRLQNQLLEILVAQHVLAAGKTYPFRYVSYDGTTLQPLLEDRQLQLSAIADKLAVQEAVMGGRITLGLRLCGQSERDINDLHDAMRLINDSGARLQKLSLDVYQLEQLLPRHFKQREADYSAPIKRLEDKIRDASTLLLVRLSDIPCPLDSRHHSLKSYVEAALERTTDDDSKSPTAQHARRLLDVLFRVNEKLSLLAAEYGTIAEEAYRIEPIKLVIATE